MANEPPADASLMGLPTETFQQIAEFVNPGELKSLRLVSRESASRVLDLYTTGLFTSIAFFINDKRSVLTAIRIASHSIFGKHVRKVSLFVDELREGLPPVDDLANEDAAEENSSETQPDAVKDDKDHSSEQVCGQHTAAELDLNQKEPYASGSEAENSDDPDDFGQVDREVLLEAHLRAACHEQSVFRRSALQQTLMKDLFQTLEAKCRVSELVITATSRDKTRPLGYRELTSFQPLGNLWSPDCQEYRHLKLVHDALLSHPLREVAYLRLETGLEPTGCAQLCHFRLGSVFETIQHLELDLSTERFRLGLVAGAAKLIAEAPNLKGLRLKTYGPEYEDDEGLDNHPDLSDVATFGHMLLTHTIPKLESLTLLGFICEYPILVSFVDRQPSLRELHMYDTCLNGLLPVGVEPYEIVDTLMENQVRKDIGLPGVYKGVEGWEP